MARKLISIPTDQEWRKIRRAAEQKEAVTDSREEYRKIVRAGIGKWVEDFKQGKIVMNTVSDLQRLIEMDLSLQNK